MIGKMGLALLLLLISLGAQAQAVPTDPELHRLLRERENLVKDYTYYNAQNSNFWGKKSKKDLLSIIETLKSIIKKDSEIIERVSALNLKKEAELTVQEQKIETRVVDDRQALQDRVHQLNQEVESLQNLNKNRQRRIGELEDQLQEAHRNRYEHDRLTVIAVVAGVLLVAYILYLQSKLRLRKVRKG